MNNNGQTQTTKVYTALNDSHRFYISDRNVILERFVPSKPKTAKVNGAVPVNEFTKEYYELLGYYPTHQAMLRAFVGSELKHCDQGITELLRKVNELYDLINEKAVD